MTFVPASSVGGGGAAANVNVLNFPADQLVHFTTPIDVNVANTPLAVTGPLTAAELAALEPLAVTGPLTDAQLAARLPLAVTGPATAADLATLATEETLESVNGQLSEVAWTAALEREKLAE